MASHGHYAPATASRHHQPTAYGATAHMATSNAPVGTFAPGTKIQVGTHRVVIQKYLSEGGFAHVYLVKLPKPVDGTNLAVLKRVAVADKDALRSMRTEVETMKRLKGHRPIVTYIDSHASELKNGGYEVFLLMEFCDGGGLIDFMNTRLQHRLTEPEILNIFTDVAEGVACMHYLKPPLLHRDIKVENVLISSTGSRRRFKVCDFGSAAPPAPAPTSIVECRLIDEDVQKHTTLQYRSPEMVDVYRKQPIDEKSDVWALGVFLYKLCYYTTPFEEQGQLAILNASFRFPSHPIFSDRLKHLIASMLQERQRSRPNIYQLLKEACAIQGRDVPIKDIYSRPTATPKRETVANEGQKTNPGAVVGASFAAPERKQHVVPEIVPMRRGRPPATGTAANIGSRPPSNIVTNGDPFAALDMKATSKTEDELSSRFPTLGEFSILHDQGSKFNFDEHSTMPPVSKNSPSIPTTEATAEDACTHPQQQIAAPSRNANRPPRPTVAATTTQILTTKTTAPSSVGSLPSKHQDLKVVAARQPKTSPRPSMVSQGTMTTTPPLEHTNYPPRYRFPPTDTAKDLSLGSHTGSLPPRPNGSAVRGGASNHATLGQKSHSHSRQPSSSRPSLESGRPNMDLLDVMDDPIPQSTLSGRPRPASTQLESNIDFLCDQETKTCTIQLPTKHRTEKKGSPRPEVEDETSIQSNVDFLRSMESDTKHRSFLKHGKRPSITSLSGTKGILVGRFGDVFKKFEGNPASSAPTIPRSPSPLKELDDTEFPQASASETTDRYGRDGGDVPTDPEDMTPEIRRETERRHLAEEERRVATAAAEYRRRVSERPAFATAPPPKSIGGVPRAVSIQNKVERLLDESQRSTADIERTAKGYGKYTPAAPVAGQPEQKATGLQRKPVGAGDGIMRPYTTVPTIATSKPAPPKPGPKPGHLATLATGPRARSPIKQNPPSRSAGQLGEGNDPMLSMTSEQQEDYVREFQKRYPSLSSLEMVEREINVEADGGRR